MSDQDPTPADGIDAATQEADERDARSAHDADRPPTPDEDAAAPESVSEGTAEA